LTAEILRFDEQIPSRHNATPMNMTPTERVQRAYPQIYLACHSRHVRAVSTAYRLSSKDSSLLAHLSETTPISPSALAKHLTVRPSTLSAAIQRLEKLGYLLRVPNPSDRRAASLFLSPLGRKAMAATSVLDQGRVTAVLARLSPMEKRRALDGLELLAKASNKFLRKRRRSA